MDIYCSSLLNWISFVNEIRVDERNHSALEYISDLEAEGSLNLIVC